MENTQHSSNFIDHSVKPNYDFGDGLLKHLEKESVEFIRPCLFFARGQKISKIKLLEYFTAHAVIKLEGDNFIKFI